jgi:superfamily II DNA or RNA helicase
LIIVHNTFLKDQWEDRIRAFLPSATIGHLQGDTIDCDDSVDFYERLSKGNL